MRRIVRGGAAGLVAVLGLGVALGQPPAAPPPTPAPVTTPAAPGVAATVNGESIPLDRVDAFIKSKLALVPLTAAQLRQLRVEVASDMVDELLLKQFLRRHGPKVEPAEIDRHLKAFADDLARQGKSLADFLRETNQTEANLRDTWTTLFQLNGYVKQHVTDEQLRKYYEANKDYFDGVEVRVSHVVVRAGPNTPAAEKAAAREKLMSLRAQVAAGTLAFADAAKKHSQCPSAPQGGDVGYIQSKGTLMDEAFCKAAFALRVGEMSDVVETEFGVHVLKVTDRKPGTPSAFEKCVEDVRDAYADDFRTETVATLRKQAQVQITVP